MAAPDTPQTSPVPAVALERAPGHLVRCAQQVHSALWHAEFDGELTSPQYAVLSTLAAAPGIDQRTAGITTSLDKSNIADVVRRLEGRGWLTRERDTKDARRNILTLTADAASALTTLSPRVERVQQRLLTRLPEGDQARFLAVLAAMAYRGQQAVHEPEDTAGTARVRLSTAPGHLLRRAEQVHYALWFFEFGSEITSPQYAVISALLHSTAPLDQRTAGEIASLDKSSVADVVRRLEGRGWLTRVRDTADARRRLLRLTPAAGWAIPTVTEGVLRVQDRLLAPLAATERTDLLAGLRAIVEEAPGT